MTTDEQNAELDAAIAEAQLTDEEASQARELLQEGGNLAAIVPFILKQREGGDDDDEEPIEQPAAGAAEPTAKQLNALDKELTRHEKRVHEVMGEFTAGFVACDKCSGVGLVPPGEPPPEPQTHEWFQACETCAGFGLVLTGSSRPPHESRDCPTCKGRGYLEALQNGQPLADQPPAIPTPPAPAEPAIAPAENGPAAGAVTFGTPAWMGDPTLGQ